MKKSLGMLLGFLVISPAFGLDFNWQPFGSAYYSQAFSADAQPIGFQANRDPQFTPFSLVGINLKTEMTPEWSSFMQLVGDGANIAFVQATNFNSFFQFGFVNYQPNDMLSFRLGRQGIPLWTAAENFRMAAQQPYRTKPSSIYNMTDYSALDGLSITGKLTTDFGSTSLMLFGGLPVTDGLYPETYQGRNMVGIKVNMEGDGWKIRAQGSRFTNHLAWVNTNPYQPYYADNLANPNLSYGEAHTYDLTAGWVIDKMGFVSWAEVGYFKTPHPRTLQVSTTSTGNSGNADVYSDYGLSGPEITYWSQYAGGYALLGYRFGAWLPRYQFARVISWDQSYPGATSTHIVGLNYDWSKRVIFKAEYEVDLFPLGAQFANNGTGTGASSTRAVALYAGFDFIY